MTIMVPGVAIEVGMVANYSPVELCSTELSVVVPTFNEKANIRPLVALSDAALQGICWEVVFVDDNSPDGTVAEVRALAQTDPRVRCLRRVGRRGLSSACVEGILSTSSPYVAVMDADLQHDETILPKMLNALRSGQYGVAVGSRYVDGGSTGSWSRERVAMSDFATRLSRMALPANLKDPMSGFFMVERQAFEDTVENLSSVGFKILVDLFASAKKSPAVHGNSVRIPGAAIRGKQARYVCDVGVCHAPHR